MCTSAAAATLLLAAYQRVCVPHPMGPLSQLLLTSAANLLHAVCVPALFTNVPVITSAFKTPTVAAPRCTCRADVFGVDAALQRLACSNELVRLGHVQAQQHRLQQ